MRAVLALLLLGAGGVLCGSLHASSNDDAIVVQAHAALSSGQYKAAQALAASGLAEVSLDALSRRRLLLVLGLAQQAVGETDSAMAQFTMALQGPELTGDERARALFARGLALDTLGRLELAIGDYTAALGLTVRAPYALNNRANVYRRQGLFTEARRDYLAALEANTPTPQYPLYGLGQIAEAQGDLQAARSYYRNALTADPGFALARVQLEKLGATGEDAAGIAADTGILVLRPPGTRLSDAAVVLKPPGQLARSTQSRASRLPLTALPVRVAEPTGPIQARAGRGAPLRPAIMETVPVRTPATSSMVQLGAWRSEAEARDGWIVAQKASGGLLVGLTRVIVKAELKGRGRFYRLRVQPPGAVMPFCAQLARAGLACLPVRD